MGVQVILPDDLAKIVTAKVGTRQYESPEAVLRAALALLEQHDERSAIASAYRAGIASGIVGDVAIEDIKQKGRRLLAERAAKR
jgi:Arc/MetJ-type ribon-helix-helix transcriptional regulator